MTNHPGSGIPLSRESAEHALRARAAERDRISGSLLDLESHTSFQLLKGAALTGLTQRRWSAAMTSMTMLWSLYDLYRTTLRTAEEVRARRGRPGADELAELTDLLKRYGEEPKASQIARSIVHARPLSTTDELAKLAARAWPGHHRLHPATRTFQALRT